MIFFFAAGKYRRQAKASRPKRFASMEGRTVVDVACNNGTSALVTKEGELFLFGKDSAYCDSNTGRMLGLKDVRVTSVSLGKAHGVALTDSGLVYSFGINNKGQCGRDSNASGLSMAKKSSTAGLASCAAEVADDEAESEDSAAVAPDFKMCSAGKHSWSIDLCMICTLCHQCTGFGPTCVSSDSPGRLPGT